MKLIVISSPNKSKSEIGYLIDFMKIGLDVFHVKKKNFSRKQMVEYLSMIPEEYMNRLVLHNHYSLASKFNLRGIHISSHKKHTSFWGNIRFGIARFFKPNLKLTKSFHSIQSLVNDKKQYDYVFLSPVFDRHEMQEFSAAYSEKQLRSVLYKTKHEVIALGGVSYSRIELARRTGFEGIAIHSAIWKEKHDRTGMFDEIYRETKRVEKQVN
jgi:thiamine-phosphate pyrophosphorylase